MYLLDFNVFVCVCVVSCTLTIYCYILYHCSAIIIPIFFLVSFSFASNLGWYEDNWYEVNLKEENISCTKEQMRIAAEGHLTTEALMWNQNNHQKTISGMSSDDFR